MVFMVMVTLRKDENAIKVIDQLKDGNLAKSIAKIKADNLIIVQFRCSDKDLQDVLNGLSNLGCGIDFGVIDVLPILATKPILPGEGAPQTRNRLPTEVIYHNLESASQVTFDYAMLLILASILAGIGLATDNAVTVVASMLVSPLMNPILAFTFGTNIRDKKLVRRGIYTEFIGFLIVFGCGLILGLILSPFGDSLSFPTFQMADRGTAVGLAFGAAIAFPSGIGVALSVTGGVISGLVGVAISAALLPPIVNSGMNLVFALAGPSFSGLDRDTHLVIAGYSCALFFVNIICIWVGGCILFKIKEVAPFKKYSPFWQELPKIMHQKPQDRPWNRPSMLRRVVSNHEAPSTSSNFPQSRAMVDTVNAVNPSVNPPPQLTAADQPSVIGMRKYNDPTWKMMLAERLAMLLPVEGTMPPEELYNFTIQ
jgi:uncharacterized hydrophobic protein (TIGR00341 family)